MIKVPAFLQPKHFPYPKNNLQCFEEWYFANFKKDDDEISDRQYLPIYWTGYLCKADFGNDTAMVEMLQWFVNTLPKDQKYYTIVQYDNGPVVDLSGLDIRVFAMSGPRIDYCLPLIYKIPNPHYTAQKDIFLNFIGRETHPVRTSIIEHIKAHNDGKRNMYVTKAHHEPGMFNSILKRSVFTLCPRGYGQTSFRIAEALACGSIPVYISDQFLIPHNLNFQDFGLLVHEDRIGMLLLAMETLYNDEDKLQRVKNMIPYIFENYFTYEANKKLILQNLQ